MKYIFKHIFELICLLVILLSAAFAFVALDKGVPVSDFGALLGVGVALPLFVAGLATIIRNIK